MDRRLFLRTSLAAGAACSMPAGAFAAVWPALTAVSGEIRAVTGDRDAVTLAKSEVGELSDSLRGNLLLPGNPGYDAARRVLNASIDRHPALIVQPSGVADIRRAVDFARSHRLLLAVKCGGHSYAGKSTCDDGMQIDLSTLRHVRIDRAARRAWVAGGSLLGELDRESMALGLVTTAGTVSHTGVGGLALGGGFGRLARRFGLALDNVESVDIVTADGRFVHASADENPDLYWGVRGGGGNFGVVTGFEFRLHEMQRQVVGGDIVYPLERARDVLRFYADYSSGAPDTLYCDAFMQATMSGEGSGVGIHVCYSGSEKDADRILAPIEKLGKPVFNGVGPADYVAIQKSWDNTDPRNNGEYLKSGFINEFPDFLSDRIVDEFEPDSGRNTTVFFQHAGGAIGSVAADATAFAHRNTLHNMYATVSWPLDADATPHVEYVRRYWRSVAPRTDGYYSVDVADQPQEDVNRNYLGNFPRLLEIKRRYDPDNLFRLNANIAPV